jgi:hypothetical protein
VDVSIDLGRAEIFCQKPGFFFLIGTDQVSLINKALFDQMQKALIGINFGYFVHYFTLILVEVTTNYQMEITKKFKDESTLTS